MFLNDEPCMVRPTLVDMNSVELKYYPFMITLNKCTESCNVLSPNTWIPKEKKKICVKAFNMITHKKLKQWQNIVHVIINANSILKYAIQIKNGITKHVNVNIKILQ